MKDGNGTRWERWRALTIKSQVVKEEPAKETEQAAAVQSRQRNASKVKGEEHFQKDEMLRRD